MESNGLLIVKRIDSLLKQRKENRNILAEAIGINAQNISAWSTRGTIPAADVAIKIANYLGISVEYLINGTQYSIPEEKALFVAESDDISYKFSQLTEMQKESVEILINGYLKSNSAKSAKNA